MVSELPIKCTQEAETAIWGTGFTPEGIDQNPVLYVQQSLVFTCFYRVSLTEYVLLQLRVFDRAKLSK